MSVVVLAASVAVCAVGCGRGPTSEGAEGNRPIARLPYLVEDDVPFGARVFARGSDGFPVERVVLLPDGRATAGFAGCTGTARREGRVIAGADAIEFVEDHGASASPTVQRYHFVRWSERTYLIEQERLLAFVNAVNEGSEPQGTDWGAFLLEEGDAAKPAEGLPALPSPWNDYLLAEPLEGRVVEQIVEGEELDVVIDLGSDHGLRVGMQLHVRDAQPTASPEQRDRPVWVETVEPTRARCGSFHTAHYEGRSLVGLVVATRERRAAR